MSTFSDCFDVMKVGTTRKTVAVAQGQRCGKDNLHILESLVMFPLREWSFVSLFICNKEITYF